ncbi:MAG: hypothetical protein ACK4ND_17005 [Cytophagaceae bacterium]
MNKHFTITALIIFIAFNSKAQDSEFKANQGDVTAEFVFLGGLLDTQLGLNSNMLRFRYFISSRTAARLGLGIASQSETVNIPDDPMSPQNYGEIRGSYTQMGINIGLERHFEGTDRLSPYIGGDFLVAFTSVRERGTDVAPGGNYSLGSSFTRKGAILGVPGFDAPDAGNAIGFRLVGGADFYFIRNIFIGAEFGWGLLATNLRDLEVESTAAGAPTINIVTQRGNRSISSSIIGNFRLGFVF